MEQYIEEHKQRFKEELLEWLRIPSVSAKSEHKEDMLKAARFAEQKLKEAGVDKTHLFQTPGHPIVYAEKIVDPKKPTVLVYGHYDVQPPEPMELWQSDPFEPVERDGKIYARGACDDKGQAYMHIKALEVMNQSGELSCNFKCILEGEEEVGSEHLDDFLEEQKDLLKADVILVSDTALIAQDTPCITRSLRGLCYMEIHVKGPNRDLHSGTYGGAVQNPNNALVNILGKLKDENNHVRIPGFYDKVEDLSASEIQELEKEPYNKEAVKSELGLKELYSETGHSIYETRKARPTLDINGMMGGYTGEGAKTVIPDSAFAKVSMRLVPPSILQRNWPLVYGIRAVHCADHCRSTSQRTAWRRAHHHPNRLAGLSCSPSGHERGLGWQRTTRCSRWGQHSHCGLF